MEGIIYIAKLSTTATVRIGRTVNPTERERNYNVFGKGTVEFIKTWRVSDCISTEKYIHDSLKQFRVGRREIFNLSPETAVELITSLFEKYTPDDKTDTGFGSEIREIRVKQGFSQSEISEKTGLKPLTILKMEKMNSNPELKSISKVLDVLGFKLKIVPK